jgi:uncharacterized membrane protein (DUF2068 family)
LKLDFGKIGLGYLRVLWLGTTGLLLVLLGKMVIKQSGVPFDRVAWNSGAVTLVMALLHGTCGWGMIRRRRWSYYLALVISGYWVIDSIYNLVTLPLTNAPRWFSTLVFVLWVVALTWSLFPTVRSQFSPVMQKT